MSALLGHLWTLGPFIHHGITPPRPPPGIPFEVLAADDAHGTVPLRGWVSRSETPRRSCVVAIHGLGGDANSTYLLAFARAAWDRGHDVVRMGMRGSDGRGDAVYHAGLASDVHALLASDVLAAQHEIRLVGFSLGGHLALRTATSSPDSRLRAVAAVGSPLDLARGQVAIDAPARWTYRQHVLRSLRGLAARLDARGRLPSPLAEVNRVRTLRGWDDLVVARRFGFDGPDAYYASESAGPHLARLAVPGLYVGGEHDPMVPADTVRPALESAGASLDVRWIRRAGHIGFAPNLDLGERGRLGFAPQLLSQLERQG